MTISLHDSYNPAHQAVCFLLVNQNKEVLAISRKEVDLWGLPGGKVESGETLKTALIREVFEETGYVVADPEPVYTAFIPGDVSYFCTTFIGRIVAGVSDAPRSEPFAGHVKWVSAETLTTKSPFNDYNKDLFQHLNILRGVC